MTHLVWLMFLVTILSQVGVSFKDFETQIAFYRNLLSGPTIRDATQDQDLEEYDFIVVGAGAAGCVVAARLSENPEWNVLLLEAGPPESTIGQIPTIGPILLSTQYGWNYKTTPQQTACFGSHKNQCYVRAGRGLGGSSAINGIVYARGSHHDYDIWASLGNPGWNYSDVLPYFKKSENINLRRFDRDYHKHGGPLNVEDPGYYTKEMDAFLKAGSEIGVKILDYNGAEQIGVSTTQFLSKNGARRSVAKAYLGSKKRKNLMIKTSSHVTKIIIQPNTKRAVGVEYRRKGRLLTALNKREVILSAGTLNSPKILMLSGIGLKKDLESVGIKCLQELNVGRNFIDHVSFPALNFFYDKPKNRNDLGDFFYWILNGGGRLSGGGVDALAYLQTRLSLNKESPPDIELLLLPSTFNQGYQPIKMMLNYKEEIYDSMWKSGENRTGYTILVILTRPKSVGVVSLSSNNPFDAPIINPHYLKQNDDVETLLEGIRVALNFSNTRSMKNLGAKLNDKKVYGCEDCSFGSDDYWRCAIETLATSPCHYMGTCKMGPRNDENAVVDNYLRVYGIRDLRLADASVIPHSITAHLEATAVMIGERAADFVKNRWQNS